jgi:hypothetical protein
MRSLEGYVFAALALAPSLACSDLNTPVYFQPQGMPLLELQGTEMPPRVTNGLQLKFRAPTMAEQDALNAQKDAETDATKFDVPWISRDKVHLELLFTVKNLDDTAGNFDVTLDGANQYTKYDQTVVAAAAAQGKNDPMFYLPLMSLHPQLPAMLGPGETYQGVFREDDFNEGEADLDAMGRWMAPYASVLLNRSEVKPIGLEMVPPDVVTPALVEVDVWFTADKHMTCEWTLRVRDDDDRLWHTTGDPVFHPHPTLFVPAAPMTP